MDPENYEITGSYSALSTHPVSDVIFLAVEKYADFLWNIDEYVAFSSDNFLNKKSKKVLESNYVSFNETIAGAIDQYIQQHQ